MLIRIYNSIFTGAAGYAGAYLAYPVPPPLLPTTYTTARGRRERKNRAHIHSTSTSIGRSSIEEMAKLNSLTLLSYSGKLYIQFYPSNPSVQTCQVVMLLQ